MTITLKEGDRPIDFTLPISDSESINLRSLKGKNIVLYFYPRDNTPGCTLEAKDFRDHIKKFEELNTDIIGISKDELKSHHKFSTEHCLPFKLASDYDSDVCEKYGVWEQKSFMGRKYMGITRSTFLIDKEGIIRNIWYSVSIKGHVDEVLKEIKKLK